MAFLWFQQAACKPIQALNDLLFGRRRTGCGFRRGRRAVGVDLSIQVQAFQRSRASCTIKSHGEIDHLHGIDILVGNAQHAAIVAIDAFLDVNQCGRTRSAARWDLRTQKRQGIGRLFELCLQLRAGGLFNQGVVFLTQSLIQLGSLFVLRRRGFGHGLFDFLVNFFAHLIAGGQKWQHRREGDGAQPGGWGAIVRVQALPFVRVVHVGGVG